MCVCVCECLAGVYEVGLLLFIYGCKCVCVMFDSKFTHCSSQGYFAGRQSTAAAADAVTLADRTAPYFAICRTA